MLEWQRLDSRAIALRHAGQMAEAIEHLTQAIELARPIVTLKADTGSMLNYLADAYLSEGMLIEAESAIRDAMRYEVEPGTGITAANLMILAKVMHRQGRCAEAVRTGKQALTIY